jgi:hypothetical protein
MADLVPLILHFAASEVEPVMWCLRLAVGIFRQRREFNDSH